MTKTLLLILLLIPALLMALIPHIGCAYPSHVDDRTHLSYAKTIAQPGKQGDFPHNEKAQDEVLLLQTREKLIVEPGGNRKLIRSV